MAKPRRRPPDPDEAAFLAALAAGDDLAALVYADWLDDRGDARAAFLRLQHQANAAPARNSTFRDRCRRLRQMGENFDPQWLTSVSRPRLAGTCWVGHSGRRSERYIFRYLPDGALNYASPSGLYQNGTWRQVGPVVLMETNRHYADYAGLVHGDRILGTAGNITGAAWRWDVRRTTDPRLCDPGEPNRTVYAHGRRRRRS